MGLITKEREQEVFHSDGTIQYAGHVDVYTTVCNCPNSKTLQQKGEFYCM